MHSEAIAHAGEVWEEEIFRYCSGLYENHWLPSHDIGHHRRVWKYACLISSHLEIGKNSGQGKFFEQLIIACYFHDIGLLYEKGPRHGKESRRICKQFLELHRARIQFDVITVLQAIEHHDDKDYANRKGSEESALYNILTLADDIDAFGAIGCYRYIEIYLIRHLDPAEIPNRILENAGNRYQNFKSRLKRNEILLQYIREKYEFLKAVLGNATFNSGPESLVNWIQSEIVATQLDPFTFFRNVKLNDIKNDRIGSFVEMIVKELK